MTPRPPTHALSGDHGAAGALRFCAVPAPTKAEALGTFRHTVSWFGLDEPSRVLKNSTFWSHLLHPELHLEQPCW